MALGKGQGPLQQGGELGREHWEHARLHHKLAAGKVGGLCQDHDVCSWRVEWQVEMERPVGLGYPLPGRLGEAPCILSEPCQPQQQPYTVIRGSCMRVLNLNKSVPRPVHLLQCPIDYILNCFQLVDQNYVAIGI